MQQYISYLQSASLLEDPNQISVRANSPSSRFQKLLELREEILNSVSGGNILLSLHRLFSKVIAVSSGSDAAIDYLFEVTITVHVNLRVYFASLPSF